MRTVADCLICVALLFVLFLDWISMGVDKEQQALNKIRNSQGMLIKIGVEK